MEVKLTNVEDRLETFPKRQELSSSVTLDK
jgi:hypothetical protein